MQGDYLFTSESVTDGHPDKIADQRAYSEQCPLFNNAGFMKRCPDNTWPRKCLADATKPVSSNL